MMFWQTRHCTNMLWPDPPAGTLLGGTEGWFPEVYGGGSSGEGNEPPNGAVGRERGRDGFIKAPLAGFLSYIII